MSGSTRLSQDFRGFRISGFRGFGVSGVILLSEAISVRTARIHASKVFVFTLKSPRSEVDVEHITLPLL